MGTVRSRIDAFDFQPGRRVGSTYEVEAFLGRGWEGEVYKVVELSTGIPRAAKVFFPQRNARDRAVRYYAKKLFRLRDCPIVIQYHHSEQIRFRGEKLTCLISEFVDGELLSSFVARQPGKRLQPFEALHLLYALATGVEQIHAAREYHSDIHAENIMVRRRGIHFDIKLVDFYNWGAPTAGKIREDVIMMVNLLHEMSGGRKHYSKQPPEVKRICCGQRRGLIARRYPTAGHLRSYLDSFPWPAE